MSNEAIIIAANIELHDNLGDVEEHKKLADKNGKVIWDIVPPGRRDIPWRHSEIRIGYFYISGTNEIQYKFLIEDVKKISEFKNPKLWSSIKKFVPDFRMEYWKDSNDDYLYAFLIKNITKIHPIPLQNFKLINTGGYAERVMNYVIVMDKNTKEVVT
jgi:hypothetical protein